ncbi:MAG: patatin-like phospholipase family protein [Marinifilaceae bacterium]
MSIRRILISFLLFVFCFNLSAQEVHSRPKIGLVLSGGGARGFAHVGVIRVLEENNIPIDYIAGTSIGAIVGGLYAMGYSVDDIEDVIRNQDWNVVLSDKVDRKYIPLYDRDEHDRYAFSLPINKDGVSLPQGVIVGHNVMKVFSRFTRPYSGLQDFSKFPIPFACVAANIVNGKEVVMKSGDVSMAIRSSMAIPTIFTPVESGDKLLVDGGMVNNLPVDVVKEMGADIVIAVDLQQKNKTKEELTEMYAIFNQGLSYLGLPKYYENLKSVDYYIKPKLSDYSIADFSSADSLITRGYRAAKLIESRLDSLSKSLGKYKRFIHKVKPKEMSDSIYISEVHIHGSSDISEDDILAKFNIKPATETTLRDIEEGVDRLYASLGLRSVYYKFEGADHSIISLDIEENIDSRLNVGLHYDSWNNAALLLNTTFNRLFGKTSKLSLDFKLAENLAAAATYSFNRGWRPGVRIRLEGTGYDFFEYDKSSIVAQYGVTALRFDVNINSIVSESYSLGFGSRIEYSDLKHIVGECNLKQDNFFVNYYAFLRMDTHEKSFYSRKGISLYSELRMMTDNGYSINGDESFFMLYFKIKKPISLTRTFTIIPSIYFNGAFMKHKENIFAASTFWGGVVETRFFNNQIPFVGYKEMAVSYKNALVVRVDLQWEVWKNKYLLFKWNVGKSSDFLDYHGFIHGISLTGAWDTPIGPLEISVMGNNATKKVGFLANIGYWF